MSTTSAKEGLLDVPYEAFVNELVRESGVVLY